MAELDPTQIVPAEPAPAAPQLSSGQQLVKNLAEAPPAETAPAEVKTPTLKDQLAELGFQDVNDDAEAAQRLFAAYKQQKEQFAAQLREAIEQVKSLPADEVRQPEFAIPQTSKFKAPKIDKQLVAQYRTADGWKDGTPDDIKQQYAAYQRHRDTFADSLLDDAESTLAELIDSRAEQKVKELLGQVETQKTYQQTIEKIAADNPWVYDLDPVSGQPKVDPTSRSHVLSADGQLVNAHFVEFLNAGLPPDRAWHLAHLEFQAVKGSRQQDKQAASQTNGQRKEELLTRANGGALPQRGASLPTPANSGTTQNSRLRPGQRLIANMQRDGVWTG